MDEFLGGSFFDASDAAGIFSSYGKLIHTVSVVPTGTHARPERNPHHPLSHAKYPLPQCPMPQGAADEPKLVSSENIPLGLVHRGSSRRPVWALRVWNTSSGVTESHNVD
jgi:hypothetical protein